MDYHSGSTMEALSGYLQHWKERGEAEARARQAKPAFTIAISRQSGARGTTTARAVGERLGWAVYDRELVERIFAALLSRDAAAVQRELMHVPGPVLTWFTDHGGEVFVFARRCT